MKEDEQQPDDGSEEEPGEQAEPTEDEVGEAHADRRPGELPRYVGTAALSAAVLLFALVFFVAGFWVHALLDEDGGGDGVSASASDDPAWGPEDASVTIEEFADFQCPYCGIFAQQTLPKIREAYEDKVRYVYRDFPLTSIHGFAQKAAEAAQCAHKQGLFWEYHDLLFMDQEALAVSDLKKYAENVGADTASFDECLDSGENTWEVLLDTQDGKQAGVGSTPAFVINGMVLSGAYPFEQFQSIIDMALASAGD